MKRTMYTYINRSEIISRDACTYLTVGRSNLMHDTLWANPLILPIVFLYYSALRLPFWQFVIIFSSPMVDKTHSCLEQAA